MLSGCPDCTVLHSAPSQQVYIKTRVDFEVVLLTIVPLSDLNSVALRRPCILFTLVKPLLIPSTRY